MAFQRGKTARSTGVIHKGVEIDQCGAAGGIGGFYLPVVMGIAKESTGSYQMGFATFGALAVAARKSP